VWDVDVVGDIAFLADLNHGLSIWGVEDPASPLYFGQLIGVGPGYRVDAIEGEVLVATGSPGLRTVDTSVCETGCDADFNDDGALNVLDFVTFQLAWVAEDPKADCNADGEFSVLDFVCFQVLFVAGCG
jgi:hypothetical protein